jgi:hypothetical protein
VKSLTSIIGEAFSFFCIAFTTIILTGWFFSKPAEILFAIVLSSAIAAGRFLRLFMKLPVPGAGLAERQNG